MSNLRYWISLVESVVQLSDFQKEPTNMTPDVKVGEYVIRPVRKDPGNPASRPTDYWVWIDGPGRDENDQIDIRRYAQGPEPSRILGLPDLSDGDRASKTAAFTSFTKRANTLAGYGLEKPPETRFNPAWVLWRKKAILNMSKQFGLNIVESKGRPTSVI